MAKTSRERRFELLDQFVELCDDYDKKFLLHQLLDYYGKELMAGLALFPDGEERCPSDIYTKIKMHQHITACEEMRDVLSTEIF